jgi:hypothetical protein
LLLFVSHSPDFRLFGVDFGEAVDEDEVALDLVFVHLIFFNEAIDKLEEVLVSVWDRAVNSWEVRLLLRVCLQRSRRGTGGLGLGIGFRLREEESWSLRSSEYCEMKSCGSRYLDGFRCV